MATRDQGPGLRGPCCGLGLRPGTLPAGGTCHMDVHPCCTPPGCHTPRLGTGAAVTDRSLSQELGLTHSCGCSCREDSRPRAYPGDAGRQGERRSGVARSGAVSPEWPGVLPLLCCLLLFWRGLIRSLASLNPEHPWTPRCGGAVNMSMALSAGAGRRPTRLLHSLRGRLLWG